MKILSATTTTTLIRTTLIVPYEDEREAYALLASLGYRITITNHQDNQITLTADQIFTKTSLSKESKDEQNVSPTLRQGNLPMGCISE